MSESKMFRDPIPTIPDEPMTRPSGIRSLAPNPSRIPDKIKEMVRRVLESDLGDVQVRRIISDETVVEGHFDIVPGMDVPALSISRLAYTDGVVMTSHLGVGRMSYAELKKRAKASAAKSFKKIAHTVVERVRDAEYIAVTHHDNDYINGSVLMIRGLTVYAREPRAVHDFIDSARAEAGAKDCPPPGDPAQ